MSVVWHYLRASNKSLRKEKLFAWLDYKKSALFVPFNWVSTNWIVAKHISDEIAEVARWTEAIWFQITFYLIACHGHHESHSHWINELFQAKFQVAIRLFARNTADKSNTTLDGRTNYDKQPPPPSSPSPLPSSKQAKMEVQLNENSHTETISKRIPDKISNRQL